MAWSIPVFGISAEVTFSPPTEPHTTLAMDAEGIARLEAELAWRERWVETWLSMKPFLTTIEDTVLIPRRAGQAFSVGENSFC